MLSEEAVGTAHDTITAGSDIVKFLYIKKLNLNLIL